MARPDPRAPGAHEAVAESRPSGHDDCYLAVESTDPAKPSSILGRLLALLAGSALLGASGASSVGVPEPDSALPERVGYTARLDLAHGVWHLAAGDSG
jgi:hypothetical protein